jgi:glutathione synthase/RimK-type ligase-like ATP-grasp enzyme
MKIAFVTYKKQEKYSTGTTHDEDETLLSFLGNKGLDIEPVIWNDPAINWTKYEVAMLKSPWDYHELFPAFSDWLNKLETLGIKLLNPYKIIRWNSDKHYMKEIEDDSLAIITSLFFEMNTKPDLQEFFTKLNTEKLIVKPCISASAKHTFIVTPQNVAECQNKLHKLLEDDSFIVQPFAEEILNGELSFIFLGGVYSHCILKLPKSGDFRVQHFHGGTVRSFEPDAKLIADAQEYVNRFAKDCLYARVDGLMINNSFRLMELELIEPYLFLGMHPDGYQRYFEALNKSIGKHTYRTLV